jgi:hypothetical protein
MNKLLSTVTLVATVFSIPALAADVGVSISVGQPGFYGRLDIGDYPPPQVIYAQPRIIRHSGMDRPPVYLRVPPGHAKNWRKHCHQYNACGERVYFVQDNWYNREYVPRYQEHQRGGRENRQEQGDRRGNGNDQYRRGNDGGENDRGGNGRGDHGKGHGRD